MSEKIRGSFFKKTIPVLIKLAITIGLALLISSNLDLHGAFKKTLSLPLYMFSAILIILMAQMVSASYRLQVFLAFFNYSKQIITIIRICFIGAFCSQTLISFIGGDGVRIWQLMRSDVTVNHATQSVVFDRISGLLMQVIFIATTLPFLALIINDLYFKVLMTLVSLGALVGFGVLVFLHKFEKLFSTWKAAKPLIELSRNTLQILQLKERMLKIFFHSLVIVFSNVIILYVFSQYFGAKITFLNVLVVAPTVLFISMLPISFAGWGLREGAMVAGLSLFGVPGETSLAISLSFGMMLLLFSLPGSVLLVLSQVYSPEKSLTSIK